MPRSKPGASNRSSKPPATGASATAAPTATPVVPTPSALTPRGQFTRRQEGQRFLAALASIAINPRNLREEWEYETEEFEEFSENLGSVGRIHDPAVCSRDLYAETYPEESKVFGAAVEWVLIAGERRYVAELNACEDPEKSTMPVVLRNSLLEQGDLALLSENTYRKGWDPIQEAMLIQRLRREKGITYKEILQRLGGKSAMKRESDISKRIKLLSLKDGPAYRAIRMGQLGLEPAYTLVTKLKDSALVDEAWALMLEHGVIAAQAVAQLIGEPEVEAPVQIAEQTGGTAEPSHDTGAEEQQTAPATFVDESAGDGETPPLVPAQSTRVNSDSRQEDASDALASAARRAACQTVLKRRTYEGTEQTSLLDRLTAHTVRTAPPAALALASEFLNVAPATFSEPEALLGDDTAAGREQRLRLADAIALATEELRASRSGYPQHPSTTRYLATLREHGDLALDEVETAEAAELSSTKTAEGAA